MQQQEPSDRETQERPARRPSGILAALLIVSLLFLLLFYFQEPPRSQITYDVFIQEVERNNVADGVTVGGGVVQGKFKTIPEVTSEGPGGTRQKLLELFEARIGDGENDASGTADFLVKHKVKQVSFDPPPASIFYLNLLFFLSPLLIIGLIIYYLRRTRNDLMGGGFLSGFSRSPAKRFEGSDQQTTFKDVAGLEGVKADLMEIVDFLRSPEKYRKLGGHIPKGVLLNGPPGTGKTLLARAIAGEAGVPFFSVNGSEFIQMFVGVGASRVRDLFRTAKEQGSSIIFIDEVDAVGRQRGAGLGGGHDEREQTLNQILSEMDGFAQTDSVIVVAATNRPDVLDPALLRPGRFDRHITVGRPSLKGRREIFKVHVRNVPLASDVDLESLAAGTIGMTGADIRNVVNEAALWAARHDKSQVEMDDFEHARDKVLMGAKREEVLNQEEKERTAYHEAGHTIAAWKLPGANRVRKVTVVPRGQALGVTQMVPFEDRVCVSQSELEDQLVVLLAGRAAEQLIYDLVTAGAESDLERATSISRRMVTHWGMSPKVGPVSYKTSEEDPFLGREMHRQRQFSEHTQEVIDAEVGRILHEAAERADDLLRRFRDELEKITRALMSREELAEQEIAELIGPSAHAMKEPAATPSTADAMS
jgi:cell division protease FtsH